MKEPVINIYVYPTSLFIFIATHIDNHWFIFKKKSGTLCANKHGRYNKNEKPHRARLYRKQFDWNCRTGCFGKIIENREYYCQIRLFTESLITSFRNEFPDTWRNFCRLFAF